MTDLPLSGYRVVDLSTLYAGSWCTRMLADYGAGVIKVEPPTGDPTRYQGPFYYDDPHVEKSGLFLFLNTNKRSMTLNLDTGRGRQIARDLIRKADVVVESFKPGYLAALGLGYEDVVPSNRQLIMTSVTNFGQTGPYRDWEGTDITLYAMGGPMKISGRREGARQTGRSPRQLPDGQHGRRGDRHRPVEAGDEWRRRPHRRLGPRGPKRVHRLERAATRRLLVFRRDQPTGLYEEAFDFAVTHRLASLHDSLYVVLARDQNAEFWTAAAHLYNSIRSDAPWVRWMTDYVPGS